MSDNSSAFKTKLLDSIHKYTARLEAAFNSGNYIKALKIFDALIEALTDIRPVLATAAEAQENDEEFDIICNTDSDNSDIDSTLFEDDGATKSTLPDLGQFPSIFPKTDHGPS